MENEKLLSRKGRLFLLLPRDVEVKWSSSDRPLRNQFNGSQTFTTYIELSN